MVVLIGVRVSMRKRLPSSHGLALHPANLAEQIAIAPSFGIQIDGKHCFQGAVQDDLKIKRLHNVCTERDQQAQATMPGALATCESVRENYWHGNPE